MLTTLVLLACLHGEAAQCREFPAPLPPDVGFLACAVLGQRIAVAWLAEHPAFSIKRILCRYGPPQHPA